MIIAQKDSLAFFFAWSRDERERREEELWTKGDYLSLARTTIPDSKYNKNKLSSTAYLRMEK